MRYLAEGELPTFLLLSRI